MEGVYLGVNEELPNPALVFFFNSRKKNKLDWRKKPGRAGGKGNDSNQLAFEANNHTFGYFSILFMHLTQGIAAQTNQGIVVKWENRWIQTGVAFL